MLVGNVEINKAFACPNEQIFRVVQLRVSPARELDHGQLEFLAFPSGGLWCDFMEKPKTSSLVNARKGNV